MNDTSLEQEFPNWKHEIIESLEQSNSLFLAFYSLDGKLIFANHAIRSLFKEKKSLVLINPDAQKLNKIAGNDPLIFVGNVTLGHFDSINTTIFAHIYKKENRFMLIGGLDAAQLIEQNKIMHLLNSEIGSLQRKLLKEKNILEATLKKLDEVNRVLEELNATKDKFFSILAHDLRNAFLSISGYSEILAAKLAENQEDDLRKFSHNLKASSANTFDLLEELLEWAKMQQGKMPFAKEKILLNPLVMDCITLYQQAAQKKQINIINHIDKALYVWADKNMLYTVIRNLIGNAIKFNYKNGHLEINAFDASSETVLTIQDNGIGMSSTVRDSLFKVGEVKSTVGTDGEKGTGLGLILCKEFIEKHDGKIQVKSEPGEGTTFSIYLPMQYSGEK